jgi:hypothetical protein
MKKLILAIVLVLCAGLCFAQEDESASSDAPEKEKFNMEVTVGVAVHSTTSPTPHDFLGAVNVIDTGMTANASLGFAVVFSLSKHVGFALNTDFFFMTEQLNRSDPQSSSVSYFGANAFVGPVFYLWSYRLFRIPLGMGVHMSYWNAGVWEPSLNTTEDTPGSGWLKSNDLQLGAGFYVGIHIYFSKDAYMISRVNFSVDMYRMHQTQLYNQENIDIIDESHAEMSMGWGIRPSIGLGMRF